MLWSDQAHVKADICSGLCLFSSCRLSWVKKHDPRLQQHMCQQQWRPAYLGTSWARSFCVGACRLTASVLCSLASASLLIALGTPTVEMVILHKTVTGT